MDSVNDSVTSHTGFPHSDIAGYNGSYHLTGAYRRLARPSSPLTARASTVYAWSLNLTTRRCLVLSGLLRVVNTALFRTRDAHGHQVHCARCVRYALSSLRSLHLLQVIFMIAKI